MIKGENHHVLEALPSTHAGKVDCIYIDPPYHAGARDWQYDNDCVDENDASRKPDPPSPAAPSRWELPRALNGEKWMHHRSRHVP